MRWLVAISLSFLCHNLLAEEPLRIASFSPGATQTVLDLGCSQQLVAATRWCPLPANHPAQKRCDAFVPDLEALLQTKPSLVILPRLANPLWAERCQQAGLHTVVLHAESSTSVLEDLTLLGEVLGKKSESEKIVTTFNTPSPRTPLRLLVIWDGMMAGPNSYLAKPLEHFGFQIVGLKDPWRKIALEELIVLNPEAILWITSQSSDSPIIPWPEKLVEFTNLVGIKNLACVKAGHFYQTTSGHRWLPSSGLLELGDDLGVFYQKIKQHTPLEITPR
jgi:ABC-type Fe3+-hydroxamate transport system substrate-binding protein